MSTEPPTYYARVFFEDGTATPAELVARYRAGAGLLRESVAGMDAEALTARPIAGKMSTLEVVGHVADCDQFLADRIKRSIGMYRPMLMDVDGSLYPEPLSYQDRDLELQLALVDATRAQLAADLDRVGIDAWSREGVHSEVGLLTVRQLVVHTIRHLELHTGTIAEKQAALGL